MSQAKKTFIFSGAVDSIGPLAAGVGLTMEEARLDAASRLGRRPGMAEAALARILSEGGGHLVQEGGLAVASDFATFETRQMAEVLSTWSEAHSLVQRHPRDSAQDVAKLLQVNFGRQCAKEGIDPSLVDWVEIAREFQEDLGEHSDEVDAAQGGAVAGRRIDADVLGVLGRCWVDGNSVKLPAGRMDRKLYERVNEVLVALGGKWVGRKVQAHVFDESPAMVLDIAISTGSYVKPQDFGFFETQPAEVERVIQLADLHPGQKALEPSAGRGALAVAMARILGFDNVTVVELLHGNARKLVEAGFSAVNRVDFLSIEPVPIYDRIVMNPPFSGLADVAHVMHAARFLKPDGRLVAITSPSWEYNSSRKAAAFREFVSECEGEVESVAAGAFKAAGTNVATRIVTFDAENFPWNRESAPVERMRA